MDKENNPILSIIKEFDDIYLIGLSGSAAKNITCDEFLPGGILKLCPLQGYEKQHELILQLIKYSDVRSIKRVQSFLNKIHFHMYTLKWLDKAIIRNDYYSFNKHSQQCIDDIITVLYSLNKQWYSEEKRLLSIIDSFQLAPDNISNRLESIIMRKNDNRDMSQCILNLKTVISEISTIAKIKFMDYAVY